MYGLHKKGLHRGADPFCKTRKMSEKMKNDMMNSYVITAYGAIGDGNQLCTDAFRQAVADCAQHGGGYVDVPAGTYLTGTIRLQSHVYLRLAPGSTLLASEDFSHFEGTQRGCSWRQAKQAIQSLGIPVETGSDDPDSILPYTMNRPNPCRALVVAEDAEYCGVVGEGCLEGQRGGLLDPDHVKGALMLVVFSRCRHVRVENITMQNPGSFTVYMLNCTYAWIRGVRVFSRHTACGDGLDFDGGRYVVISDCIIDAGDDGIGLKTLTPDEPCEDFTITNCHIRTGNYGAIRLGPESVADMRRITVSNCVFNTNNDGIKVQLCEDCVFEDLQFSDIVMHEVVRPFFITNNRYAFSIESKSVRPSAGIMRRVSCSNIHAIANARENHYCRPGSVLVGIPGSVMEDFSFSNVYMQVPGGDDAEDVSTLEWLDYTFCYPEDTFADPLPSALLYCKHVGNVRLHNCRLYSEHFDSRPAIVAEDVGDIDLQHVSFRNCEGLLRHMACPSIRGDVPAEDIHPYTAEQTKKWKQYRDAATVLEADMTRMTSAMDALSTPSVLVSKSVSADTQEAEFTLSDVPVDKRVWLLCPEVNGGWQLQINGILQGELPMPPYFRFSTPFFLEVTEALTQPVNRICLVGTTPNAQLTCGEVRILITD